MSAQILPTLSVEKVWGREQLPAPFSAPDGQRIGEIWFDPPAGLDSLLAKYLFTSEKLSVQVHPPGKDECWLVLECDPGASLAVGFRKQYSVDELRQGALDGSIEQMLVWHPVAPGDFVYLPAGTVHAIGAGCTLVELQQNCGITYRFYDYGRPRELHLEEALAHAERGPHDPALRTSAGHATACLVDGPFFRLDRIVGAIDGESARAHPSRCLVLPLAGSVECDAEALPAGSCAMVGSLGEVSASEDAVTLVCSPRG